MKSKIQGKPVTTKPDDLENKTVKIKVLRVDGEAALVEYVSPELQYSRHIVPVDHLSAVGKDEYVDYLDLISGIEYGDNLLSLIQCSSTPEHIENELHRHGVFTYDDAMKNLGAIRSAFLGVVETDIAHFLNSLNLARKGQG